MHIRSATVDDASAIESVRLSGWRAAYGPLLPAGALDDVDLGAWSERRAQQIAAGGPHLVAVVDGRVQGFCCYGASRDDDDLSDEVYGLYVSPSAWSTGLGRTLLGTALIDIDGPAHLWVLRDNQRALRFYQRAGFAPDGISKTIAIAGTDLCELRYRRGHR